MNEKPSEDGFLEGPLFTPMLNPKISGLRIYHLQDAIAALPAWTAAVTDTQTTIDLAVEINTMLDYRKVEFEDSRDRVQFISDAVVAFQRRFGFADPHYWSNGNAEMEYIEAIDWFSGQAVDYLLEKAGKTTEYGKAVWSIGGIDLLEYFTNPNAPTKQ